MCCKLFALVTILGALNWGLIATLQIDFVAKFFGPASMVTRVIYGLFGLAGLLMLVGFFVNCPKCPKCCKSEDKK